MALYYPQGSGTLRQQLLMMRGIALYCMVLHQPSDQVYITQSLFSLLKVWPGVPGELLVKWIGMLVDKNGQENHFVDKDRQQREA